VDILATLQWLWGLISSCSSGWKGFKFVVGCPKIHSWPFHAPRHVTCEELNACTVHRVWHWRVVEPMANTLKTLIFVFCGSFVGHSFFSFHWHYSPLWALACRTISLHFVLSVTNSLHLLTPSTWRSLSTSSLHPFLELPLCFVPSCSWVKIFLGILFSSIPSRWPNQLLLYPFIPFTIFFPLLISSSSRFVLLFHSPFSYLGPYILLNIFLSNHRNFSDAN